MPEIGKLEVAITGSARGLKQAVGIAKRQIKGLGGGFGGLERRLGRVADLGTSMTLPMIAGIGAIAGFVGMAVNAYAQHEQLLSNIGTLIDGTAEEVEGTLKGFEKGAREIALETAMPLNDLEKALYDIVSAGIDSENALTVLMQSAILAKAGLGSTEEAADLLTSALNSYGLESSEAQRVATIFFETVKAGKTTVSGLAQTFGSIAPIASTLGVSLEELQAATATLTTTGLSASESQTALRSAMTQLMKPGKDLEDVLNVLGVESGPRFDETLRSLIEKRGLVNVLGDITTTGKEMGNKMGDLFGSIEAVNAVMILTGKKGKDFEKVLSNIETQTDKVGIATTNLEQKFRDQTRTTSSEMQKMRTQVDIMLQDVGGMLLDVGYRVVHGWGIILDGWGKIIDDTVRGWGIIAGGVGGWIQETAGGVAEFFGGIGGWIGETLGLQRGGIVTRPTLAVVGEAGPEAVIPLREGGMMGTVIISPQINIEASISGEVDINDLAQRIADIQSEELRGYIT